MMIKEQLVLTMLILISQVAGVLASPGAKEVRLGNEAYSKTKYDQALELYESAALKAGNDARIDYDLGVASYKLGKYKEAVDSFNKALLSDDKKLVISSRYNLGNALYQKGVSKEDQDIKSSIKNLEEALGYYDNVIVLDKDNKDAKSNRVFVSSELERLRKKQKEQKNEKSSSGGDQNQNKQASSGDQEQQFQSSSDDNQAQEQENAGQSQDQQQDQLKKDNAQAEKKEEAGKNEQDKESARKDQKNGDKQGEEEKQSSSKDQDSSAGQVVQERIVSQDEVNMLLDDFAQNEQPKGMLNFMRDTRREKSINKDW